MVQGCQARLFRFAQIGEIGCAARLIVGTRSSLEFAAALTGIGAAGLADLLPAPWFALTRFAD
jgi:hypothetical protein